MTAITPPITPSTSMVEEEDLHLKAVRLSSPGKFPASPPSNPLAGTHPYL